MRIGVLGTGVVGQTLSAALARLGHDVAIGTRDVEAALARSEGPRPGMPSFAGWHGEHASVRVATFPAPRPKVRRSPSGVLDVAGFVTATGLLTLCPMGACRLVIVSLLVFELRHPRHVRSVDLRHLAR